MESLLSSRYDWIEVALENYRVTLDIHLVTLLDGTSRGKGPAVVWGETQQGKTSLILFLMGVDEKYRERVGAVLRGGRPKGESATPVPILYSISLTDDWHCSFGDWKLQTNIDEHVSQCLAAQRREMEREMEVGISYNFSEPLRIAIPKKFFGSGSNSSLTQALDLPGLNANTKSETEFAKGLDHFLSESTLVLIVHSSKKIMGVFNATHELRTLRDWWLLPNKVRLVLTHAYSLKNSRQIHPQLAIEAAITDITEAISEEKQSLAVEDQDELVRNLGSMIAPIELGEGLTSIYEASRTSASIETWDAAAIECILEARERLVIDVEQSYSIQNEIKSLRAANTIIRRRHEQRLALSRIAIGELEQKSEEAIKKLEKVRRDQAIYRERVKYRNSEMSQLTGFRFTLNANLECVVLPMDLHDILSDIKRSWRNQFKDFMICLKQVSANLNSEPWTLKVESEFAKTMKRHEATFESNVFGNLPKSDKKQAKVIQSAGFIEEVDARLNNWCQDINRLIKSTRDNRGFRENVAYTDDLVAAQQKNFTTKIRRLQGEKQRFEKDSASVMRKVESEELSYSDFRERNYRIDAMLLDSFSAVMQKYLEDLDSKQGSVQKYETGLRMLSLIHEARKV